MMAGRWSKLYKGTASELALEDAVAALGVPYRTQFPGFLWGIRYFLDFALPTLGVVIEVDDVSHSSEEKRAKDAIRTKDIEAKFGWRVLRCTNEEAKSDPNGAVRRMLSEAKLWPVPRGKKIASCLPAPSSATTYSPREKTRWKAAKIHEARSGGKARANGKGRR